MGNRNFLREAEERKARLDRLIDHYERESKPDAEREIQVDAFPGELKFATRAPDGQLWYRGRVLIPVKRRSPSKERYVSQRQSDIER